MVLSAAPFHLQVSEEAAEFPIAHLFLFIPSLPLPRPLINSTVAEKFLSCPTFLFFPGKNPGMSLLGFNKMSTYLQNIFQGLVGVIEGPGHRLVGDRPLGDVYSPGQGRVIADGLLPALVGNLYNVGQGGIG